LTSVTAGIVVVVFFVLYQQLENHVLQPVVYGRTVQLSPLAVLIAVLIGAEVAGVLGALGAIPIAGTLQILLVDWRDHRRGPGGRPGAEQGVVARGPGAPAPGAEERPLTDG
jgi:predicted PurR-regulated permease PerM